MTKPSRPGQPGANYGIIGNVTARAVAVGEGARAVSTQTITAADRQKLTAAVDDLQKQIAALSLPAHSTEALQHDVEGLKQVATHDRPVQNRAGDLLGRLIEKLKLVGVLVETITPLSGPIKTIAAICGIPLPF